MYSKTILVQDSDVQRRAQIRYTLSLDSYKVLEAASPGDAQTICSVREIPIDLVIRDAEAESGLKWPRWRPCAPLLALSTFYEPEVQDSPDDFWLLPFDPEQLIFQVSSILAVRPELQTCLS